MNVVGAQSHTSIQLASILFATDFSTAAAAAIPYAAGLTKRFGAELHMIHVRPLAVIVTLAPPTEWKAAEGAAKIDADRQKQDMLAMSPDIQPHVLVEEGILWSRLESTIEANEIGVIVIGTHGRNGTLNRSVVHPLKKSFEPQHALF
jgi:nucleotide-binding universal stress UspA family protein